jgi:hypothetical protein
VWEVIPLSRLTRIALPITLLVAFPPRVERKEASQRSAERLFS